MVTKTTQKIKHKFNRTFAKPSKNKVNKYIHDRRSTLTDEEILRIREEMKIVPKSKDDMRGYVGGYQKPL